MNKGAFRAAAVLSASRLKRHLSEPGRPQRTPGTPTLGPPQPQRGRVHSREGDSPKGGPVAKKQETEMKPCTLEAPGGRGRTVVPGPVCRSRGWCYAEMLGQEGPCTAIWPEPVSLLQGENKVIPAEKGKKAAWREWRQAEYLLKGASSEATDYLKLSGLLCAIEGDGNWVNGHKISVEIQLLQSHGWLCFLQLKFLSITWHKRAFVVLQWEEPCHHGNNIILECARLQGRCWSPCKYCAVVIQRTVPCQEGDTNLYKRFSHSLPASPAAGFGGHTCTLTPTALWK